MGLDMYLKKAEKHRSHYYDYKCFEEVCYWRKANQIHSFFATNAKPYKYIDKNTNQEEVEEDVYVITKDIILNLQNICMEIVNIVSKNNTKIDLDLLLKLKGEDKSIDDIIEMLLDLDKNKDYNFGEILPTRSGFFFGSTDYDEYYFYDIVKAIFQCNDILETINFEEEQLIYWAWC